MYIQAPLAETNSEVLLSFIRENSFGILVLSGPEGAEANHLPFEVEVNSSGRTVLRAHVSLANPAWKYAIDNSEALVVFQGAHSYMSPAWHPARKTHGKVAPSWNYSAVHVCGNVEVVRDSLWLRDHLGGLVRENESTRSDQWFLSEAPEGFLDSSVGYIVGLEIPIEKIYGKFQASQQYSKTVRAALVDGLRYEGGDALHKVADMIESRMV